VTSAQAGIVVFSGPHSLFDGAVGDAVSNPGPDGSLRTAIGALTGRRPGLGGSPPGGSVAIRAYATDARRWGGRRLDAPIMVGQADGETAGEKDDGKH